MRDWSFVKFIRASGRIGGGSVIFALLLFAIAVWEHHAGQNVPTSVLVVSGVAFWCYGCYLAWIKELSEKESIVASIEKPKLELTLPGWTTSYDGDRDITVFFMAASVLNKGHQTSIVSWMVSYQYGSDIEYPTLLHLNNEYNVFMDGQKLTFTNENLITVKCRERAIGKGGDAGWENPFYTPPRPERPNQIWHFGGGSLLL